MIRLLTLPAGFILDLLMGDPRWLYHPVCLIGNLISILEKGIRRVFPKTDKGERAGGILEVVLVCFITFFNGISGWALHWRLSGADSCLQQNH